ncbi:cell cycle checkpoint protein RAD1-like [Teleopsis dalmanni]|uniref:cell cycle checkpoint protein RAD1-like n=1 Tax=Teleopsis dalmanni TaxID=139649 RepID=UPI0018CFA9A9|nr:cell cycle checkpoint protein RAD1-like [Teleopsis dalmanni]XP_037940852.1 cell cycle checkpoint protein RAD1-like [Teleopsis dalmanni]XP_037954276.1 cell cycle checkpoint protein RAD1-like [Teleopsis dalmanni]
MQHSKILYEKGILKNLNMLTQSQYSNFKFVGRLDNIKTFYSGIKALNFGEYGSFQITDDGFRVTVENGKTIQASLFITMSCFSEYHVDGIVNFSINMNVISECLGIFSATNCSIKMFYKGHSAPLIIVLEPHDEDNITTECAIKTTNYEEPIDFSLDEDNPSLNVIFIRGPDLSNIFHELDKAAEEIEITLSPRRPHFKIDTLGVMQSEASIEVAKTSDMMMLFNCRETTTARYNSSQIRLTLKALSVASKVAIKTDSSGLLEMHFMMQSEDRAEMYVQFYITPQADV